MRTDAPRVHQVTEAELDPDLQQLLPPVPMLNIFSTLANNPTLMKNWWSFANHVLLENSLRMDLKSYDCIPEYTRPKPGVAYPIHDYDKKHHFGAKSTLAKRVPVIFGK